MANPTGTITASTLNVRIAPSTDAKAVTQLPRGTVVEVLGQQGTWFKIRSGPTEGFVSGEYVKVQQPAPAPPPAPAPGVVPAPAAGFLAAQPTLRQVPLAPAKAVQCGPQHATGQHKSAAGTWNAYGGLLGNLSGAIKIPQAAAAAVLCVESGGKGFVNGRMVIRFENHCFWDQWGKSNPQKFAEHFVYDAEKRWTGHKYRESAASPWIDFHGKQDGEWAAFGLARKLDETAAMKSISMGLPQIMGFNHKSIGYATVQDMFAAFSADERYQILGMFDFIQRNNPKMVQALAAGDFEGFAKIYNGPGQAAAYGAKIKSHCDACTQLLV